MGGDSLADLSNGAALSLVQKDSDPSEVDDGLNQLHQQVAVSEERIAELERELEEAADQEAATARQLDTERQARAALDQQLRETREEATRLKLEEANRTRTAAVTEAEELLRTSRIEAEREASKITKQTFNQAKGLLAEAKREGDAILDDGRERLNAMEAETADRVAELDAERQDVAFQLDVMAALYDELQTTLKLVAETSLKELAEARSAMAQLDPSAPTTPHRRSNDDRPSSGANPGASQ